MKPAEHAGAAASMVRGPPLPDERGKRLGGAGRHWQPWSSCCPRSHSRDRPSSSRWSAATPGDPRFKEVDENVVFQLGFPNGALGSFSAFRSDHRVGYLCVSDRHLNQDYQIDMPDIDITR